MMEAYLNELREHLDTPIPDEPDLAQDWHAVTVGICVRMADIAKAQFRQAFAKSSHEKGTVACQI